MPTVEVQGPDGKTYEFPDGTDKAAAVKYFKAKGIGVQAKGTDTKTAAAPAKSATSAAPPSLYDFFHTGGGDVNKFFGKALDRISSNMESMAQLPGNFIRDARQKFKESHDKKDYIGQATAIPRAELGVVKGVGEGIYSTSTPGLISRVASKEDPANIAGDVAMTFLPGGEEATGTAGKFVQATHPEAIPNSMRILSQEMSGAGKEIVLGARRNRAAAVQTQELRYQDRLAANERRYQQDIVDHSREVHEKIAEHESKLAKAKADYDSAVQEHVENTAAAKAEHEAKVSKLQRDWANKALAAEQSAQELEKVNARREALTKGEQAATKSLGQNIRQVHQTVRDRLTSRWHQFRQSMAGATVPAVDFTQSGQPSIYQVIEDARSKLKGSPADIKQFNDLIRETGIVVNDDGSISVAAGKPSEIPVETARVHSTAIGSKLMSGDLPGNVYQAVKSAKEGIESLIETAADGRGQGDAYRALKRDWSQYESDWNDMRSVASGKGSVLARALRAPSGEYLRPLATGKGSSLMQSALSRYESAGAKPALVKSIRDMVKQTQELPRVKVKEAPKKLETPAAPKEKAAPTMKDVAPPTLPDRPVKGTVQPPRLPREVDPKQVRLRKLEEFSGRPFRWYDLFPPYLVEHLMLKSPEFREWVASQPRKELPVPAPPPVPPYMQP